MVINLLFSTHVRQSGGMGKCVTSTTDWPHLVASSTYNDTMK